MATKVQHQNVATLHDFSALPDGSHYMVWEFIDGENLAQVLRRRGTLAPRHAVRIAIQALAGLEAIHRAGIVHRDISPENLMITQAGDGSEFVKIIDLGVAKAAEADVGMTQTGMFVGKFRYASPDHLGFLPVGERIDGRADLYSLGVVLFEMLTGRPPFEATSPHAYILHHSRDEYLISPDLDRITGSPALQTVLARALERDRNKRFPTAREFSDALAAIEPTLPDESSRTAAAPFDADATMRTERTNMGQTVPPAGTTPATAAPVATTPAPVAPTPPAPPTIAQSVTRPAVTRPGTPAPAGWAATPAPAAPVDALPTMIDPMPMAAPKKRTGLVIALIVIALLVLVAMGAVGVIVMKRFIHLPGLTTTTTTTTATTTTAIASAKPSQTTVEVTPPTPVIIDRTTTTATTPATATTTTSTTAATMTTSSVAALPPPTTTHAPVKPKPRVEVPPPVEEAPQPAPQPEPAPSSAPTFREKGDGGSNDAALAELHRQIGGVTRVSISGGDAEMINQLSNGLRRRGISIGDDAQVEIRFTGSVESHGFGKKSRSATATVKKNGRPVFQYYMPREEYRVGDSPAEAFVRILSDALGR